ncbi:lipopolysaccharide-induced tumor necrosis factor-alpha factor homolog [Ctenocephalides felis]|uniref:lipopolysaccharide-induced tumor necrosis factor-alpha factor homolog n=1 Tax=Ctenocephalides felis TaxID=7515 RepID=UPI000E6E103D|nr:lipopolysaccharide-induced tumor necrosis factor-alpha factor homolog [Ctenocephalides felis]
MSNSTVSSTRGDHGTESGSQPQVAVSTEQINIPLHGGDPESTDCSLSTLTSNEDIRDVSHHVFDGVVRSVLSNAHHSCEVDRIDYNYLCSADRSPIDSLRSLGPPPLSGAPPSYSTAIRTQHLLGSSNATHWSPRPLPVVCPRCAALVVTDTRSRQAMITHLCALTLCLCGCWPCCLLPYCMDSCKNTYHTCPACQHYLGTYTPW